MEKESTEKKKPTQDEIVDEIISISNGVQKLLSSRLSERAIIVLIHDSVGSRGYNSKPSKGVIQDVIRAAANLKNVYLKKLKAAE